MSANAGLAKLTTSVRPKGLARGRRGQARWRTARRIAEATAVVALALGLLGAAPLV